MRPDAEAASSPRALRAVRGTGAASERQRVRRVQGDTVGMSRSSDGREWHQVGYAAQLIPDSGLNRLRFSASEELLAQGARVVFEAERAPLRGVMLLLAAQGTRATHSFESVIALCRIGRGAQAAMINRSLLEDALDAHWVAANPDDAPALADQHERLIELGERALLRRFGRPTKELDESECGELDRLGKLYDGFRRSWTLTNEKKRIALVKKRWSEPGAASYIDQTYEVIQRQNNALLHSSPTALGVAMTPGRRGLNVVGPDPWWRQALAHGVLAYYFVCRVIAEEFGVSKDAAAEAFFRASCFTKEFEDDEARGVRSGDSCPCGSGLPLAECHNS